MQGGVPISLGSPQMQDIIANVLLGPQGATADILSPRVGDSSDIESPNVYKCVLDSDPSTVLKLKRI